MAEKEERIWIDYPLPKNAGAMEARRCTTMTRQEAIERMAKAYCSLMWGDRYSWEEVPDENKKYFYNFATVGLNALLEGK